MGGPWLGVRPGKVEIAWAKFSSLLDHASLNPSVSLDYKGDQEGMSRHTLGCAVRRLFICFDLKLCKIMKREPMRGLIFLA